VTSRSFLRSNPEAVKRFLAAMVTAVFEYKDNPDIAIPLTQKFLSVKDEADAKAAYEAYAKIYPDDLRPSLAGMRLVLGELAKTNPKAAAMKPEQFVDTSTLDGLERDGFFKRLRGQ
jgi:ABC-type nitrate/sulfonate/bicarbonate transport system substrate-binding protein